MFVDEQLNAITTYMKSQDLVHFDAHFENILTDGELLYFSDFGLSLSSKFDLTTEEVEFLNQHKNYDQYCSSVSLLHCIITSIFGKEKWESHLREYLKKGVGNTLPNIDNIIKKYSHIAMIMDEFFRNLQKNKTTLYPKLQLDEQTSILSNNCFNILNLLYNKDWFTNIRKSSLLVSIRQFYRTLDKISA